VIAIIALAEDTQAPVDFGEGRNAQDLLRHVGQQLQNRER